MSNLSIERIEYLIGRLEHVADNIKFGNVSAAQELLQSANGLRDLQEYRKASKEPVVLANISPSVAKEKAFLLGAVLSEDEADAFADGWNACRAAMLSQFNRRGEFDIKKQEVLDEMQMGARTTKRRFKV